MTVFQISRLHSHCTNDFYHIEYVVADELGAGVHVEEVRVRQRRRPDESHGQFSVLVNFRMQNGKDSNQRIILFEAVPHAEFVLGHEAHGAESGVVLPYLPVEVVRRPDVQLLLVGVLLVRFSRIG